MRDRTLQILLTAAIVLGALIALLEYRTYRELNQDRRQSEVFDLNGSTLQALRFNGTNFVVHCEKKDGVWLAGDPQRGMGRADESALAKRVAELNSLRKGVTISAKQLKAQDTTISNYGFDTPLMNIEVLDSRGISKWVVGGKTADSKGVYVQKAGEDDIFTVSVRLLDAIPTKSEQIRSRAVFTWSPEQLQRIELRRTRGFLRVVKGPEGIWRIQQPMEVMADPGEFLLYLNQLCQLRIESFEAENVPDLSVYGLQEEGSRQISLSGNADATTTLVVGDAVVGNPGYVYAYRKDDTSVFTMSDDVLELLNKDEEKLRDARLLTIPAADVSSIRLMYDSKTTELNLSAENGWEVTQPANWPANPDFIGKVIRLWSAAVIADFDVQTNSVAPNVTLEFASAKTGITNTIEVLPVMIGDGLLIRHNHNAAVHQINLPIVPNEILDPLNYKSKRVWTLRKSDVKKLTVRREGQAEQVVERGPNGGFIGAGANGNYQLDLDAIESHLDQLANLTTPQYVVYNPRNLDIYGLSTPAAEVYVGFDGTNELGRVLLIGNLSTEGYYAMVKGRDVIFYLDENVGNSLMQDLLVEPKALDEVAP